MKLSLLSSLFCLPLFAFLLAEGVFEQQIIQANTASDATINYQPLFHFRILFDLGWIPALTFALLGLAGVFSVLRRLCWNEGCSFWRDFWLGIRRNWRSALAFALFYSFVFYLINAAVSLLSIENASFYVPALIVALLLCLFLGAMALFSFCALPIYTTPFGKELRNSFYLACQQIFAAEGLLLLFFLPWLFALFFQNTIALAVLLFLSAVFLFGGESLIIFLYSGAVFDRLINQKQFPSFYRKGLFQKSSKEEDDAFLLEDPL